MKKIRIKPFLSPVYYGKKELLYLKKSFESKNWSSFKGDTKENLVNKVLQINSKDAFEIKPLDIRFLGGKYVRELEYKFAKKFNSKYCISSNSATSSLVMALGSLNLGVGDEVIIPSMSFNATATSVLYFNSIPVFCEVKNDTFCIDPIDFEKKITKRTKAVIVVHLGGNAADIKKIIKIAKKYNIFIIEDTAQAPGVIHSKKYLGTFGDVGVFSLTETKNITSGEGGLLITNNKNIAIKSRLIRNHGEGIAKNEWDYSELLNVIGMNFRLTELQAAIAVPQFESLEKKNKHRINLKNYLFNGLKKYNDFLIPPKIEKNTTYIPYMIKWLWLPNKKYKISRNELVKRLNEEGIPVGAGYSRLMHENPIFTKKIAYTNGLPWIYFDGKKVIKSKINYGTGSLNRSETINKKFIWFKFINYPNTKKDMDDVIKAFNKILDNL